jgi:hypothetical protein
VLAHCATPSRRLVVRQPTLASAADPYAAVVFRDSRGVVHTVSSSDPVADLPPGAALALQQALLAPPSPGAELDLGSVLERCDAARELVERWQDAFFASLPHDVDLVEEARWAAEAGLSLDDVEAGYEDDDDEALDLDLVDLAEDEEPVDGLVDGLEVLLAAEPADDDPRRLLPEEVVAVLERELLLLPVRVRLEALLAAGALVEQWSDLVADREKLLGHLVLAHGDVPHPEARGHEELAARHAVLHTGTGPDHPATR